MWRETAVLAVKALSQGHYNTCKQTGINLALSQQSLNNNINLFTSQRVVQKQ
jgi:hypothetical protein